MANMFSVEPANPLQALMTGVQGYDAGAKRTKEAELTAGRQSALEKLMSGADIRQVMAPLIGAGDIPGAKVFADFAENEAQAKHRAAALAETTRFHTGSLGVQQGQLAQTARHQADTLGVQRGQLDLAQQTFDRKEEPEKVRVVRSSGIDPASPEGRQALFRLDEKLTTADRKAIFEAEDDNATLKSTVDALESAKALNPKAFTGVLAGARGYIGSNVPGASAVINKEAANATLEWQKLMQPEALKNMASTLKGATTDFELRTFIAQLADPTTPPDIRGRIIDRLIALSERKTQINQVRMDQLRGGAYYKPGGGQSPGAQAPLPPADVTVGPTPKPKADQSRVPPKIGQVIDGYRFKGGDPADRESWIKLDLR